MRTTTTLKCAGESDTGRVRSNNEDRFYMDPERGIFLVVDGIGGQAAGEIAAEEAVRRFRARLERQIGTARERIMEGITLANNEIFRLAQSNPEWAGMACVLTAAVVEGGELTVGHVGDTRLYKIHNSQIRKITRDHSPVGELEDSGQMSELEAMHHPRRNEVLRDVGSAEHTPDDEDFIDIYEVPFEPDCALLMCSDGLSDLVTSEQMLSAVRQHVGNRSRTVRQLIDLANEAGGKDNVTVIFVEGEQFASSMRRQLFGLADRGGAQAAETPPAEQATARESSPTRRDVSDARTPATPRAGAPRAVASQSPGLIQTLTSRWACLVYGLALGILLSAFVMKRFVSGPTGDAKSVGQNDQQTRQGKTHTVGREGAEHTTISAALEKAQPGDTVLVAEGEYRGPVLVSKEEITIRSQKPRGAVIVPGEGPDGSSVGVQFEKVGSGRLVGFVIRGGGALDVGLRIVDSSVEVENVEVTGARGFGVEYRNSTGLMSASFVHDNAGGGVSVADGAYPRLLQNLFAGNGVPNGPARFSSRAEIEVKPPARVRLDGNVFTGDRDTVTGGPAVDWGENYFSAKRQEAAGPTSP